MIGESILVDQGSGCIKCSLPPEIFADEMLGGAAQQRL